MSRSFVRTAGICVPAFVVGIVSGCGGGMGGGPSPTPAPIQVSGLSPFSSTCGTTVPSGTLETFTPGSAVQPQIAAIPGGALVGVWEQDRWSGLGARGILTGSSTDGGATWSAPRTLPFSACGGGAGLGAAYDRASDPWISFGGSGIVFASALAFSANGYTGGGFGPTGGPSAVMVSRSSDGGATWNAPIEVFRDANAAASTTFFFNDRDSITADPFGHVYLVWDRLPSNSLSSAPAYLARSSDGGATWSTGVLYDPGAGNEAFNNEIVVLPNGTVLDFFTLLPVTQSLQVVRSTDSGVTWSAVPVQVANMTVVGTPNPGGTRIRDSAFMAQVAVDPLSGTIAAVWQQSFSSSNFDGIALSISKDGGATWSATPKQINGLKTAAAFNPTVRYLPGGVLAVTYYDLRDFAPASSVLGTDVWLTESSDGGATWHELRLQGPFDLKQAPLANVLGSGALFLGDNQGLAAVGSNALPFYAATNGAGAHVYAAQAPDPLTSASAHVYTASLLPGALPAVATARSRALAHRIRSRAAPAGMQP